MRSFALFFTVLDFWGERCFFAFFQSFLYISFLLCFTMHFYILLYVAVVLCDATVMMMMSFFVLFLLLVYIVVLLFFSFSSIIIVIIRRRSGRSTRALFEFVQQRERGRVESVSDDWFVLVVDEETNHAT